MAFQSRTGGWKTWNSTLYPKDQPTDVKAQLTWKILRDHGSIKLFQPQPITYNVTHVSGSHVWNLESPDPAEWQAPPISAKQLGNMGRAMVVSEGDNEYEFLPISKLDYHFVVREMAHAAIDKSADERDGQVGTDGIVAVFRSTSSLRGSFSISFHDDMSWPLRAFLNWMAIMWLRRWHRQSQY